MNNYSIALFLHVVSALGFFVTLGLEWTSLRHLRRATTTEHGPVSLILSELLHDPILAISIQIRVAVALGIVFLMTVKPDLDGSLLTIALAMVLGLVAALPMTRRANPLVDHHQ